jgi:VWFA-related protein
LEKELPASKGAGFFIVLAVVSYYWGTMVGRFLSVGVLLALSGPGQTPPPNPDKPALRVTTRLVQVNVVVHRGSEPATGLTREDFQIFDKGKEQRIAAFSGGTPGMGASTTAGSVGSSTHVFSNRTERGALGVTIVLFDALNTPPSELSAAKAQAMRSLNQLEGNNSVALYALGGRLLVLHDFTQDIAHLRSVLEKYPAGSLPVFDLNPGRSGLGANPATAGTPLGRMANDANTELSASYSTLRTDLTLSAIEAIARHVQSIPGRKNLIWISSGFPIYIATIGGSESFHGETRNLARILTDADVAVYPVHTAGLTGISSLDGNVARTSRRPGATTSAAPPPPSMLTLADETGGKAFYGTNDLAAAMQKAISDAEAAYTLGFYPSEESLDGKFHEIRVHVKARGADVRYRRGYFATPETASTPQQRQAQLNQVVSSPLESSAIAMKVRIDPADQPKPGSFRLIVGIDLNTLSLAMKGDHHVGGVQMMLVQQSANGRRLHGTDETIRLDLAADEFERMTKDGLVLVKYVEPAPEVFEIRVFLLDTNSGALGSVFVPVTREISVR